MSGDRTHEQIYSLWRGPRCEVSERGFRRCSCGTALAARLRIRRLGPPSNVRETEPLSHASVNNCTIKKKQLTNRTNHSGPLVALVESTQARPHR